MHLEGGKAQLRAYPSNDLGTPTIAKRRHGIKHSRSTYACSTNQAASALNGLILTESKTMTLEIGANDGTVVKFKTECFIAETANGCDMGTLFNEETASPPGKY